MPARWLRATRAAELSVAFVGLPLAVRAGLLPGHRLAVLVAVAAAGLAALLLDPSFAKARLWSPGGLRSALPGILARAVVAGGIIAAVVILRDPSDFLVPPARGLQLLLGAVAYTLLSALPQEVLYRVLFFHRYAPLFPGRALILASGVAFSLQHVIYPDLLAAILSLPAGWVFATTYARSTSVVPVWIEHSVWGGLLFGLGLGGPFTAG